MVELKSFHAFLAESKRRKTDPEPINFLSWAGSHAEMRELESKELDAKLKKHRHKQRYEKEHKSKSKSIKEGLFDSDRGDPSEIHRHADVKPQRLLPEHIVAIKHYASTSSKNVINGYRSSYNINNYLRNRAGDLQSKMSKKHSSKTMDDSVVALSSAFTPENTNRITVEAHCGDRK